MFVKQDVNKMNPISTPLAAELTYNNRGTWTLKLTGSIDNTNRSLRQSTESDDLLFQKVMATRTKRLVIDLTAVEGLDSQGLRYLYDIQKQFSPNKIAVVLKNPNVHLQHLFRIMQFNRIFIIEFDDEREVVM